MSYDHMFFRPKYESFKMDDLCEDMLAPIGYSHDIRKALDRMFEIEWYGVGKDFCWGNWFGKNEGAEFKLNGKDVEINSFRVSTNLHQVLKIAKNLNLWVLDPQQGVLYRPNGEKVSD